MWKAMPCDLFTRLLLSLYAQKGGTPMHPILVLIAAFMVGYSFSAWRRNRRKRK